MSFSRGTTLFITFLVLTVIYSSTALAGSQTDGSATATTDIKAPTAGDKGTKEPKVYGDQDLKKYKYSGDETQQQEREATIKKKTRQRKREILQEIQIVNAQELPVNEICLKLGVLLKEYDELIGNDKEEQANIAGLKLRIRGLCKLTEE